MGKINLDLTGRLPVLELITPSKPVRELIKPAEPFDFHLRQAHGPSPQPESSQSPRTSQQSDSAHKTPTQAPNQTRREVSDSEPQERSETATRNETETSDTGHSESQVTELEKEDSVPVAEEEESAEDEANSEQDEVTLNGEAVPVVSEANQKLKTEESATAVTEGENPETASIDADSGSDQEGKNQTPESISAGKSNPSSTETTSSKLALEGESAELPVENPNQVHSESSESTPQGSKGESEKVYHAASKPPLVSTESESAETIAPVSEESTEEKQPKQASSDGEASLKETEEKSKTVKIQSDDDSGQKEDTKKERTTDRRSVNKLRSPKQTSRSAESQDKIVEQSIPVETSPSNGIQQVLHTETDSTAAESRPQTNHAAASASDASKATAVTDTKGTSETSAPLRNIGSIREATFGRAARAQGNAPQVDISASVDRAKFVMRVSRALHISHERGGEIRLRLSPPELGSLTLEIQLKDGVLTAQLEAETTSAQKLLLENLSVLKDRLAEQQIRVERFDVELADRSAQNHQEGQQQGSTEQRQARGPLRNQPSEKQAESESTEVQQSTSANSSQLNVVI